MQRIGRFLIAILMLGAPLPLAAASALTDAVKRGDVEAVRALLRDGADVNAPDPDSSAPLHWAVNTEHLEITDLLLTAGADPGMSTRYNVRPLALAAANGNGAIVERLLDAGADPDTVSEEGQTALMSAALNGRTGAIRALIRRGARINAVESYRGQTALMLAAGKGNTGAVEALIESGADLHARSQAEYTALLFAVRNNRYDTAQFLLEQDADVNDALPNGVAALNMAVLNADYDLAALLLDFGADPNTRDPRGAPLHTVVWLHEPGAPPDFAMAGIDPQPPPLPSGRLTALDIARILLEEGADPDAEVAWDEGSFPIVMGLARNPPDLAVGRHYLSYNGATPFYLAARNGDAPMMRILAAGGADTTRTNVGGVTPLMGAACLDYYEGETAGPFSGVTQAERLEAVKLTVELGNDVNARTDFGDYPMIGTAEGTLLKYPDNMEEIVDFGVGDPRFNEMTALHGAVLCNQPSIVEYLIEAGARVDARNQLGWTPLMMAVKGIYIANAKRLFPSEAEILRKALAERGQQVDY